MAPVNEKAENVKVAGYLRLSYAPLGTTEPTKALVPSDGITPEETNLDPAFVDVGYTEPESTVRRVQREVTGIPVHQAAGSVRNIETSRLSQITIALRNYSRDAYEMARGGGTFTDLGSGHVKFDERPFGQLDEWMVVLDMIDGMKSLRVIFRRATLSSGVEINLPKSNASDLAITIDALQPDSGINPTTEIGYNMWASA